MGRHTRRAIPRRITKDARPRREDYASYVEYSQAAFVWGFENHDPDAMTPLPETPEDQAEYDIWYRNEWLKSHGLPLLTPEDESAHAADVRKKWSNGDA